jgi:hypothetical protein
MADIIIASFLGFGLLVNTAQFSYALFFPKSYLGSMFWVGVMLSTSFKKMQAFGWIVSISVMMLAHEYNYDWTAFMIAASCFMSALVLCFYFINRDEIEAY